MDYTLSYCSSRSEVWNWYWKAWRTKHWRVHVLLAAIFSMARAGSNMDHLNIRAFALYFAIFLPLTTLVLSAIPQVLFKSKERRLRVGPEGWSTQIGKVSGSCKWSKVAAIQEENSDVIITGKNGNALIIPARAFSDSAAQQQFFNDIRRWHRQYVG